MNLAAVSFLASLVFGQLPSLLPLLPVPIFVHDVFLLLLLAASALTLLKKGKFETPKLSKPILAFLAAAVISLALNLSRASGGELSYGLLYLGRFVAYSLIYAVIVQKLVKTDLWLRGLYGVGLVLAVLGLLQFALYPMLNLNYLGWDPYYFRLFSTLFDPNFAGLIFALAFFLGMTFPKTAKMIVFQTIIVVSLFLTFSRSSYLAFLAGLLIYSSATKGWKLAFGFTLAVIIFILVPKPGLESFNLVRTVSSFARLQNYQQSFNLFLSAPVFGHGFNLLGAQNASNVPTRAGAGIDNSLLFVLATTGLLGFSVLIYFSAKLTELVKNLFKRKETKGFGVIFLSSLTALIIHSLFNNSLFYPWTLIWFWILLGIAELKAGR